MKTLTVNERHENVASAIHIEDIASHGLDKKAIRACNEQLDQIVRAVDAGDKTTADNLFSTLYQQAYPINWKYVSKLNVELACSTHPLWNAIHKSVAKLSNGFLAINHHTLTEDEINKMTLVCLNNLYSEIMSGGIGIRANKDYISMIQNKVSYNGSKPETLIRAEFEITPIRYINRKGELKDGKIIRSSHEKDGLATTTYLPPENEYPDLYASIAIPEISDEDDFGMALSKVVIYVALKKILTRAELSSIFLDYCARGDAAFKLTGNDITKERKKAINELKANLRNRAAGSFAMIKSIMESNYQYEAEFENFVPFLDEARKKKGGLKRLIRASIWNCHSTEFFEKYFGDYDLLDLRAPQKNK
jgi:hypothetical protein